MNLNNEVAAEPVNSTYMTGHKEAAPETMTNGFLNLLSFFLFSLVLVAHTQRQGEHR